MLDNQDKLEMKQIIAEGTSDIRQNVSNLQQDVSVLQQDVSVLQKDVSVLKQDVSEMKIEQSRQGVLMDVVIHKLDMALENFTDTRRKVSDYESTKSHVFSNHENRITSLEIAFSKKMSSKKKKSA